MLVLGRCGPGPGALRSRSVAVASPVRTFPRDLRRHTLCRPLSRPRSSVVVSPVLGRCVPGLGALRSRSSVVVSPVHGRCVPGPHFSSGPATPQATSPTFPSQVPQLSVPGPRSLRPRSVLFPGTCDAIRSAGHFPVPGPAPFCGPGTVLLRTCNGTPPDLRRDFSGPGTVLLRTRDGTSPDRGQYSQAREAAASRNQQVHYPFHRLKFPNRFIANNLRVPLSAKNRNFRILSV